MANQSDSKFNIKKLKAQEIINEVNPKFNEFKKILDEYPFAFSLQYSEENGYYLVADIDFLNSDNPIELSKHPFSLKHL
ncbi:hypothetical protein R3X25_11755 [Lutibacter sp. TH_r2]|uniref:hypothetical protein n=1 Tax=Lutibacter sp. TH_r2 TaxID=3082083 RepID=UPI002955C2CD|nr:hypothetical protein [Lutibacter sp. TH_r2]MDV7187958.1 hypothetical protein [Lutibacter sp. TH_r2]